jgi:hypothetical protein
VLADAGQTVVEMGGFDLGLAERRGGARRPTLLWWSGLVLIVLFGLVVAAAALFFMTGCEVDCGDSGGRGMFALVVISTPLAAVGATLAWLGTRAGAPRGAPPFLRRAVLAAVGLGLAAVAFGLALLAIAAFVEAFRQFDGWLTGDGLSGPVNYPEYMHDQARDEGIFMSGLGFVSVGLAVIAATPVIALVGGPRPPRLFRTVLLILGWLAIVAALFAFVGVAVTLIQSANSLRPGEIAATLTYPSLPAVFAAGAFATARRARR